MTRTLDLFRDAFHEPEPDDPPPEPVAYDDADVVESAVSMLSARLNHMVEAWDSHPTATPEGAYDAQRRVRGDGRRIMKLWHGCSECPRETPCRADECREQDRGEAVLRAIRALCWYGPVRRRP